MSLMDMMQRANEWMTPDRSAKMGAIGQGLQAFGAGRPFDMNASYNRMMEGERQRQAMQQLQESGVMERFTPEQQAILAQMPPQAAQSIITQALFAPAPQARIEEVNNRLVNIDTGEIVGDFSDPDGADPLVINGQVVDRETMAVLGDYRTPDAAPTTDDLTEYNAAVAQGYSGTIEDWISDVAKASGDTINNNIGAGESAFTKETGTILAREADTIVQQGSQAQRALGQLATLDAALGASPEGFAASLTKLAGDVGIKTDGASNLELANALISQMVPAQRPPGSGQMSDADLALFKASLPQLMNTAEGNKKIIATMRAIAEYDVARMRIARQQQLGEITPQQAFAAYEALGNPMSGFVVPDGAAVDSSEPVVLDGYTILEVK